MIIGILGMIIGILVICFSVYYLFKEKGDSESSKIYGVAAIIGIVIFAVGLIITLL